MLVAKGLRKKYKQREVVKDFGLTLDAGEVVGLLGPNGAGKTTCFYMIVGLVAADAGSIVLDGKDITGDPMYTRAKQGVGYLPQEPSVFRKLTVADNIRLVLELREDLDSKGRERELNSLLDELQLGHVADQLGASLSGGERRRCEIARALAAQPRLILLDEPFAGVDPISVGEIQRIVTHLKQRGIGVLITDHNVRETLGICDRAYILAEGSVLAQGSPEAILTMPTCVGSTLGIPSSCDCGRRVPFLPFGTGMKTRLQTSLGQHLVLTPQLQQAIKLLQMSTTELELEIAQAVESNPLLDWADSSDSSSTANEAGDGNDSDAPQNAPMPVTIGRRPNWTGARPAAVAASTMTTTTAALPSA